MDLKQYFDKNKDEDINNLIRKKIKKSEEMKVIERKTNKLHENHLRIYQKFLKDHKSVSFYTVNYSNKLVFYA